MKTEMKMNNRLKVNLISLLISCGILFVAVHVSDGSFANSINTISENLDKAISDVMVGGQPNFTNIDTNASYVTKILFQPRGMAGLYNLTKIFMDLMVPKDLYPESLIKVKKNKIEFGKIEEEWKDLLFKYWGILIIVLVVTLLIVFMPLCGFCFCCCRCCGKCGARTRPSDKKHDLCKKFVWATLLICLATLLLFGVVCAFVSNEHVQEGVDQLTDNLQKSVNDANKYINATNRQVDVLLVKNYDEFETVLLDTINKSNSIVYDELANYSNATAMTELVNIVNQLPNIHKGFDVLKYSTNTLRVYASQLNDAVRKVKRDLLSSLGKCPLKKCQEIYDNISTLQTNIHFNSLPDITDQIDALDKLNQTQFESAVANGKKKLDDVKTKIGNAVTETLKEANQRIEDAGQQIKMGAKNVTKMINDLQRTIDDHTKTNQKIADDYIRKYGPYRYYVGLGVSCTLLLICLCVALGLICGICGKRPDVYGDDDCCNKGAGSQFLICGVMIMFLSGFVIACFVLVGFLSGVTSQRLVCDTIRKPNESKLINVIDNNSGYDLNIGRILTDCYANKSIYKVLNLKSKFDLDKVNNYLTSFNISGILNSLDMSGITFTADFHILDDDDRQMLQDLAQSKFANVNFDKFKEILENNFTTFNLSDLSNALGDLLSNPELQQLKNRNLIRSLESAKTSLEIYQERIVEPMIDNATAVVKLAKTLETDLRLGHSTFKQAIDKMLDELTHAENVLKDTGVERLKNIAKNFTQGIINQVQHYLDRIVDKTKHEVGKCGPLTDIINNTLTATCDKIVVPWNGFWFGLLCSLILFIPTIYVSVKLAKLYQKYNPYRDNFFETEYLYDAYADRDNIPLNSRNSKASKKKNKKYKRYEDRPVPTPAGDMVAREFPGGSHHQDTRYADMAPKHWEEFPAGGPPQYQRAPTEYERPPPYYYPGAGETQ